MEQQQGGDQTQLLPEDMLAGILARLAPRSLAACRRVCKAWRDTIDGHGILRAHLLPLSLAGLFINFHELRYAEFFSRPPPPESEGPRHRPVECTLSDHCNGLLLGYNWVSNPATGWTASLPPPPPKTPAGMEEPFFDEAYLAYDPTVSAHYEVVMVPQVPYVELDIEPGEEILLPPAVMESEWPPSSCTLRLFSSSTGRWEERTFSRLLGTDAAGTVAELATDYSCNKHHAVYWHGALYVQCPKGFVMRLSLSNSTYQVIKPPGGLEFESCIDLNLGKSNKGVYFALVEDSNRIRVWVLTESCGHTKWVLQHDTLVMPPCLNHDQQRYGPWVLQEVNYNNEEWIRVFGGDDTTTVESAVEENFEWGSDDDNIDDALDTKNTVDNCNRGVSFLGFHPFKEIIFLSRNLSRGLAYNLNTSKIQDLGNIYPKHYDAIAGQHPLIEASFPYTPCWMAMP